MTSLASLPTRLQDWRMSSNQETFAYGGDEVDLSVWNTESAFAFRSQEAESVPSKKRKRGNALLPGEIWRASNVTH
jgi:ribosome biogenesis protein NSA1